MGEIKGTGVALSKASAKEAAAQQALTVCCISLIPPEGSRQSRLNTINPDYLKGHQGILAKANETWRALSN